MNGEEPPPHEWGGQLPGFGFADGFRLALAGFLVPHFVGLLADVLPDVPAGPSHLVGGLLGLPLPLFRFVPCQLALQLVSFAFDLVLHPNPLASDVPNYVTPSRADRPFPNVRAPSNYASPL